MGYLGLFLICGACALFIQRSLWRWRKRTGKSRLGFYPTGAALGNALQTIQAIAQPQVKYFLEEKLEDPADEDDEAESKDPTAHLMRQARRIRNGERVDRLTALLPP
jgi:hypothetical protein